MVLRVFAVPRDPTAFRDNQVSVVRQERLGLMEDQETLDLQVYEDQPDQLAPLEQEVFPALLEPLDKEVCREYQATMVCLGNPVARELTVFLAREDFLV